MEKLCVFVALVLLANQTLGMNLRSRRQSNTNNDNDLEDRYGWNGPDPMPAYPWSGQGQLPNQWGNPDFSRNPWLGQINQQRPSSTTSTTTQAPSGSTTQSEALVSCMRSCPVTSEYNPVCGSDNITYSNPGRLICAQMCGAPVQQVRTAPCPTTPVRGN